MNLTSFPKLILLLTWITKSCCAFSSSSTEISRKIQTTATTLSSSTVDETSTSAASNFRSRHWEKQEIFDSSATLQELEESIQSDTDDETANPIVVNTHSNKDGDIIAVEISSVLAEKDASTVQALAQSIRDDGALGKSQFQHRSFGEGKGGNDCTYLAPVLQATFPHLALIVVQTATLAWKTAGWDKIGHPDPRSLGIRTSEHLSYNGWRSLEAHKDVGSMYTAMIALKDPSTYLGGEFFVQNSLYENTDIKPNRLSAIVFLSNTTHGVRPISDGHRESFVTELWNNDDAPLGMNRPTPEEWEAFLST